MSSRRRSLRERKAAKYEAESTDEDEEEDPKMKKAKKKLEEMMRDDSDAESDFEKEMSKNREEEESASGSDDDDDFVGEGKENKTPPSSKKKLNVKRKQDGLSKIPKAKSVDVVKHQTLVEQNKGLNLSESDSSEDETLIESSSKRSAEKASKTKSNVVQPQTSLFEDHDEGDGEGDTAISQKLMALASNLESEKSVWVEKAKIEKSEPHEEEVANLKDKRGAKRKAVKKGKGKKETIVTQVAKQENAEQLDDISNLLVQGEGAPDEGEEEDGGEADEEKEPLVSKDGVEITVAMPEGLKKKKRKGFDVAAYIKRKIGKARREVALLQHQAHYVCMLAHLRHIDHVLNKPILKAVALSLVPSTHCRSSESLELAGLVSLVTWVQGKITIDTAPTSSTASRTCLALLKAMETFKCRDVTELVLVFVLICRSLGYNARFVANLALVSQKPTDDIKLTGEGSLKTNLGTLHGRRMCTDIQSLKRGLSEGTAQEAKVSNENEKEGHNDDVSAEQGSGKKRKKETNSVLTVPPIKVEDAETFVKTEIKEENPAEKVKSRSRSRKRSGLWETIPTNVKAEQSEMKADPEINVPKKAQPRSKKGRGKTSAVAEEEVNADEENPPKEIGKGKQRNTRLKVEPPPQNVSQEKSEFQGETLKEKTASRRTSRRLSTAPFSTEKLKPEDGEKGESDSDSDFEQSKKPNVRIKKKGQTPANKESAASKKASKNPKGAGGKGKRAESEADIDDDCEPPVKRKSSRGGKKNSKTAELESDDEEFEPPVKKKSPQSDKKVWCEQNQFYANSAAPKSRKPGMKSKKVWCDQENHWAEVYLEMEGRWVTVDLVEGAVDKPMGVEAHCSKPILHVLGVEDGTLTDVTRRYTSNFLTEVLKSFLRYPYGNQVRKLRTDAKWLEKTLAPFQTTSVGEREKKEEDELSRKVNEAPLPSTISGFKDHPLYALKRHLLKFEAIYPANAPTLGFTKSGEAVFARECVRTLNGRTHWLKEGRTVIVGELPYKVVKARPKYTYTPGQGWIRAPDEDLDVFGEWQTKLFEAPPAVDGIVPRNEYGNVELFKPWMLPPGTVHVQETIPKYLVRRTGIDAAPAMIGWDFSGGGCHPVFDGLVVCKENEAPLREAWAQEQELQERREEEKREKRVLDNWKRLIRGLTIKQKIKLKYMKD